MITEDCELVHSGRMRAARSWNPSVSLDQGEQGKVYPVRCYKPVSRFKPLLHGYLEPQEPTRCVKYPCGICGMLLTRKLKKKESERKANLIEKAWNSLEEPKPQDRQYQAIFDQWWSSVVRPANEEHLSDIMQSPKVQKKVTPHHLYHHKFCTNVKPAPRKKDQTVICADCPDPHRPWLRGKPHQHNPCPVEYPLSKQPEEVKAKPLRLLVNLDSIADLKKVKQKPTEDELIQRRNSKILKESLSNILRSLIANK